MILEIDALDAAGRGVARSAGKVVFVEGALAGELVEARLLEAKPKFDRARVTGILRPSASRRTPRCPHFGVCGGCVTQHADARTQVAAKQRGLEDNLARIGKLKADSMLAPIYGEEWGYRHRARLSVRFVEGKGGALVGFRETKSTYVADMNSCEVLPPRISALIVLLRNLIGNLSIRDRVPQVEIAVGDAATVLLFRHLLPLSEADHALLREFAAAQAVHVWLQPAGPETVAPFHPIARDALFYDLPEFGVRIAFQPSDFTQVNPAVNRLLVSRMMNWLFSLNFFIIWVNLPTLASSSGASTSSNIQNGAGLIKYMANNKAVAVNVFSPPLNWPIDEGRLPFGFATISIAVSARFSGSTITISAVSSSVNNA